MNDDTKTTEWPPPMPARPWIGGVIQSSTMLCNTLTEHWELLRSLREAVCTLMADRHDHRHSFASHEHWGPSAKVEQDTTNMVPKLQELQNRVDKLETDRRAELARGFPAIAQHDASRVQQDTTRWNMRQPAAKQDGSEQAPLNDKWREATGCDTPNEARRHLRSWRQEAESSRRDYLECAKELRERVRELAVGEKGKPLVAELTPVYIAHRLAGDIQGNLSKAAQWVAWLAERYYIEPVCPWITLASVWIEEQSRVAGLEIDRAAVRRCKWFFAVGAEPGLSSGMQVEADAAQDAGVPVRNLTGVRFPPGRVAIEHFDAQMAATGIRKRRAPLLRFINSH